MVATDLRIVQFGHETTYGTAVTATVQLTGIENATLHPIQEAMVVPQIGSLAPSELVAVTKQAGEGTIEGVQTYQDLPQILSMLFGVATPSGMEAPYTRAYEAPLTTAPTPERQTIEFGAPSNAYKATSALLMKYRETIEEGDYARFAIDYACKSIATVSLANLSDRLTEAVRAADTVLYMDAWDGTMGSTAVAATVIKADIEIDPKYHTKTFLGSVSPEAFGVARWVVSLKMTVEFAAASKALVDALIAGGIVRRQIELRSTSGDNEISRQFAVKLADTGNLWTDREGNMTLDTTWEGEYNSTFGNHLKYSVDNDVATLA